VIERVSPAAIAPSAQGYADVQSPEFDTKVRPVGVVSATDTPAASDVPPFVTTTVYTMLVPAVADAGPVFATARSALRATGVDAVDVLFALVGSVVDVETVAVFTMGFGDVYDDGTEYVVVIVAVAPEAIVPSEHGYAVVHAPAFETKVSPVGVVSATETAVALFGPLFVTATV
jgi:hypothetical protein